MLLRALCWHAESCYKDGKLHGVATWWDEDGNVITKKKFENHKMVENQLAAPAMLLFGLTPHCNHHFFSAPAQSLFVRLEKQIDTISFNGSADILDCAIAIALNMHGRSHAVALRIGSDGAFTRLHPSRGVANLFALTL